MRPVYLLKGDHGLPPSFWANVLRTPSCWLWTGGKTADGYGQFYVGRGKRQYAHRLAAGASFFPACQVDHTCSVPNCVNLLECLEMVTPQENTARATAKRVRATHCPCGLEYTPDTVYLSRGGYKTCKPCAKRRSAERYRNG